jgi:hypothetical protein
VYGMGGIEATFQAAFNDMGWVVASCRKDLPDFVFEGVQRPTKKAKVCIRVRAILPRVTSVPFPRFEAVAVTSLQ